MPRRRLLAIGTSNYQADEFEELTCVPDAVETVVDTFADLGFETRFLLDPTDTVCKTTLQDWFHEVETWDDDDMAVLYLTGHGFSDGDDHFLAMTNTATDDYAQLVETRFLIRALGNDPSLRRLLVLLDTCYSESGSDAMMDLARSVKKDWNQTVDRQYWVVSATRSKQEAQQLVFAKAFIQALTKLRGSSGTRPRFISLGSIVRETNLILDRQPIEIKHRATYAALIPASGEDNFFENPAYIGDVVSLIPPEIAPANELDAHWLPQSRGGPSDTGPSLFQGRERAMDEIAAWASATDDPALLVVTGAPGTGKSALLAQFVVPQSSSDELANDARRIRLARAVFAHGLTAEAIRRRVEDLLSSVAAENGERQVVIIDALDEAVNPGDIEALVLEPLLSAGVRVAVGARPKSIQAFLSDRVVIDLDQHREPAELTKYVIRVLTSTPTSPYKQVDESTHNTAAAVAGLSGSSFLLAGHIARTLTRMERPLEASEIEKDLQSFGSLASVFENDLRRIGDETGLMREALTALAWSRGAGLPWEGVWPAVCGALFSPRAYTDEDVRLALDAASDYVVEMLIDGRSYFRLYHELFAEHLRRGMNNSDAHARITQALLDVTPTDEHGERDWTNAHPYVLAKLAEHAAQGNKLDELLQDPQTVMALDPESLGVALGDISDRQVSPNESAVLRCLEHLRVQNQYSMSQLALAALQTGATDLATRAGAFARRSGAWWPQWGRWSSLPAHAVLARLQGAVSDIRIVEYEGEVQAIAASKGGEVICTAVSSGRQIWRRRFDMVSALATDGDVVAVATGAGPIHICRVSDGQEFARLPNLAHGENGSIRALAVCVSGEETLVAAGVYNGFNHVKWGGQMRLWRLDMPNQPVWTSPAFGSGISSLEFMSVGAGLQLVAGGDPFGEPYDTRSVARIFDAETGNMSYQAPSSWVSYADRAVAHPDGAVLLTLNGGQLARWNPHTGETLSSTEDFINTGSALSPDGSVWLIGHHEGLLVRSATTLQPLRQDWSNGPVISALSVAIIGNRTFVIAGTGEGGLSRWDLASLMAPDLDQQRLSIMAITTVTSTANDLVTYSVGGDGDGELVTVLLSNGEVLTHLPKVAASALHSTGSAGVVYVGHQNGTVDVLDAGTLKSRGPQLRLHDGPVEGITDVEGWLITCGRDAQVQILDINDLEAGPVCPPLAHEDYKRRPLDQIRVTDLKGSPFLGALDYEGELVFWRLQEALVGEISTIAEDGRNAARGFSIASSSHASHAFCVWNSLGKTMLIRPLSDGSLEMCSHPLEGTEVTEVWQAASTYVAQVEMLGRDVLLTAGEGGVLRAWELPARRLIAEAVVGAQVTCLCPVNEHAVLVGTDSGIVFLHLT